MKPNLLFLAALLMTTTAHAADLPPPPDAAKRPYMVKAPHGAERNDEYYWLRDDKRTKPEMLAYLQAENAYADAVMAPLKPLQETLYNEIVARIKQDDSSVPYRERGYWYYTRFETGQDYPIHARRKGSMEAAEEILLDVTGFVQGTPATYLAFSLRGREGYDVFASVETVYGFPSQLILAQVPEPVPGALMFAGLLTLAGWLRRRDSA